MRVRRSESRTGRASTCAATAHAQLAKTERVSLPPKPPPMRTTFETTLFCGSAHAFATPRRLTLSVMGLPAYQPERREEKTGPRLGANDKAVKGFLRALGPGMSLEDCEIREDKKGPRYLAVLNRPGRPSPEVIADTLGAILKYRDDIAKLQNSDAARLLDQARTGLESA